jgi:16S rRNA (cytosine1402-N4)-methyltransferase
MPGGKLIGIDCDKSAIEIAKRRLARFGPSFIPIHANFTQLGEIITDLKIEKIDGLLVDLGVSSMQLEDASRGFSFTRNGPLDMRFDRRQPLTAEVIIKSYPLKRLTQIFRELGEERFARGVALALVRRRGGRKKPWRTLELAEIVRRAVRRKSYRIHPATRVFQALRIEVNREIDNIQKLLSDVDLYLGRGGRIVVICFHSLEDRVVKQMFKRMAQEGKWRPLTLKPVLPTPQELGLNPRARSARLRACEKIS